MLASNMWRPHWFRVANITCAHYPEAFSVKLSREERALYRIMCVLRNHLSDTVGVCGSFALHVAEHQHHLDRVGRWVPGDIDLFVAGENGLQHVVDVVMDLKRSGCALELVHRSTTTSSSCPETTAGFALRNRLHATVNAFLHHPQAGIYTQKSFRTALLKRLKPVVQDSRVDPRYRFKLLDVLVDGEHNLSFVLCQNHSDLVHVMDYFDLSICRMALQTDDQCEFVVRMTPAVERDFHLGRCAGDPSETRACAKRESRMQKYVARGYRFVGNRCVCEGMCGGDRLQCACVGSRAGAPAGSHVSSACLQGDCGSRGCCRAVLS